VYYSSENCAKFDVDSLIFGDVLLEMLHYNEQENKFKQLFVIQFHSFFINGNSTRFTKDQIDGICKDIRYPNEFFIDIIFDEDKATTISTYEEDVAKWKNIISDFIMKSYKSNSISNATVSTNTNLQENEEYSKIKTAIKTEDNDHKANEEKDEDVTLKHNTLNKAQEILNKFKESKENKEGEEEEEDDDDDDIEDYLRSLENKTK
jgi:hypothetical protein